MATKTKTFDCVDMKNRIQAKRMAEYETHKGEYASYLDFVNARVEASPLAKQLREKIAEGRGGESVPLKG